MFTNFGIASVCLKHLGLSLIEELVGMRLIGGLFFHYGVLGSIAMCRLCLHRGLLSFNVLSLYKRLYNRALAAVMVQAESATLKDVEDIL